MSAIKEHLIELETDFERLSIVSMKWDADTWLEQVNDKRFVGDISFNFSHAYWFEDYSYVMCAKNILKELGHEFEVILDSYSDQWMIITSFVSVEWRS